MFATPEKGNWKVTAVCLGLGFVTIEEYRVYSSAFPFKGFARPSSQCAAGWEFDGIDACQRLVAGKGGRQVQATRLCRVLSRLIVIAFM